MVKKLFFLVGIASMLGACLPAAPQTIDPAPISDEDLRGTAAVLSDLTLQAIADENNPPTETPIVETPSPTSESITPTETENPILLTLTATLGTGTPDGTAFNETASAVPNNGNANGNIGGPTTPQVIEYGTLPPSLPGSPITIHNKANADAYIALRGVTKDGYVSYLEYPVKVNVETNGPNGKYTYVAWVGGRQFTGSFSLNGNVEITLYKDKVTIKSK